jgi:hypothetical protein
MKRLLLTTAAAIGLFATGAQAFQVQQAPPVNYRNGVALECAIVRHTPGRDSNPAYKVNVYLGMDNGVFQSLDVGYTLVNGRQVSRTDQYQNGRTWATPRFMEWWWSGTRPGGVSMTGRLYHNDRDGWMYFEQLSERGRVTFQMLADCHEQQGE